MMTNDELLQLVLTIEKQDRDAYKALYETTSSIESELVESWTKDNHDITDKLLTAYSKLIKRICKRLGGRDYSIEYEAGRLSGIIEAYESLFSLEKEELLIDAALAELLSRSKPSSKKILRFLYESRNDIKWTSNAALEKEFSLQSSALSNIMKRLVQARAVDFMKEGRTVSYRITQAGKRYYEQKIAPNSKNDILQELIEIKSELAEVHEVVSEQSRGRFIMLSDTKLYLKGNNMQDVRRISNAYEYNKDDFLKQMLEKQTESIISC